MNSQVYTTGLTAQAGQLKYGFQAPIFSQYSQQPLASVNSHQIIHPNAIYYNNSLIPPQVLVANGQILSQAQGTAGMILQQQHQLNNTVPIVGQQSMMPLTNNQQLNQASLQNLHAYTNQSNQFIQLCNNNQQIGAQLSEQPPIFLNNSLFFQNGNQMLCSNQFIKQNSLPIQDIHSPQLQNQNITNESLKVCQQQYLQSKGCSQMANSLSSHGLSSTSMNSFTSVPSLSIDQTKSQQQVVAAISNNYQYIPNQDFYKNGQTNSLAFVNDQARRFQAPIVLNDGQMLNGRVEMVNENIQEIQYDDVSTNSQKNDQLPLNQYSDLVDAEMKEKLKKDPKSIVKMRRQQQNMLQKLQIVKSAPILAKIEGCFYYKVKEINQVTRRLNSVLICAQCQKPFTKKCNLIDHLRVHSGKKPFQCKVCSKFFKQKAQLSKHCKKHPKSFDGDEENDDLDDEIDNGVISEEENPNEESEESQKSTQIQEESHPQIQMLNIQNENEQNKIKQQVQSIQGVSELSVDSFSSLATLQFDSKQFLASSSKSLEKQLLQKSNHQSAISLFGDSQQENLDQSQKNIIQAFCLQQKDIQSSDQC